MGRWNIQILSLLENFISEMNTNIDFNYFTFIVLIIVVFLFYLFYFYFRLFHFCWKSFNFWTLKSNQQSRVTFLIQSEAWVPTSFGIYKIASKFLNLWPHVKVVENLAMVTRKFVLPTKSLYWYPIESCLCHILAKIVRVIQQRWVSQLLALAEKSRPVY